MIGTVFECIAWLSDQDPSGRYEAKEHKRRRSLTQNAYYWAMLNKLARKLRISDSEAHLNMLRDYGVCEVMSVRVGIPIGDYFKYYDEMGVDYLEGEERRILKIYKGSSRMDSTEFSRLIDGLRFECIEQGIDVATPDEIAAMRFVEPERTIE